MGKFHRAAMETKAAGDEPAYKEKPAYAEQLLNELTAYVENAIKSGPQALEAETWLEQ